MARQGAQGSDHCEGTQGGLTIPGTYARAGKRKWDTKHKLPAGESTAHSEYCSDLLWSSPFQRQFCAGCLGNQWVLRVGRALAGLEGKGPRAERECVVERECTVHVCMCAFLHTCSCVPEYICMHI